jgi:hypothetical protein
MSNQPDFDKELAEMTDRLLAGLDSQVSPELEAEAELVKTLHQMMSGTPDAAFRTQLTQQISMEWDRQFQARSTVTFRTRRILAFAAMIVVVFFATILISLTQNTLQPGPGTAAGAPLSPAVVVAALVVVLLGGLLLWRNRH